MTPVIERSRNFANRVSLGVAYAGTQFDPATAAKMFATTVEETLRYIESLDLQSIVEQLACLLGHSESILDSNHTAFSGEAQTDLMDTFGYQHSFIQRMGNAFDDWTRQIEPAEEIVNAIRVNYLQLSDWTAQPETDLQIRQGPALLLFANGLAFMVAATEQFRLIKSSHERDVLSVAASFGGSLVIAQANKMVKL